MQKIQPDGAQLSASLSTRYGYGWSAYGEECEAGENFEPFDGGGRVAGLRDEPWSSRNRNESVLDEPHRPATVKGCIEWPTSLRFLNRTPLLVGSQRFPTGNDVHIQRGHETITTRGE